jgi:hypothetical protein
MAAKKNQRTFKALKKAEVKAIKSGAKAAKDPMTMSKAARNSGQLAKEFNQGYISGKQDMAKFKRAAAKKKATTEASKSVNAKFTGMGARDAAAKKERIVERPGPIGRAYDKGQREYKRDAATANRAKKKSK